MNIAILGFGTVGTGVYKIINNTDRQATNLNVKKILIRENHKINLPEMTNDIDEILDDIEIDVVVEVIGGIEPAHRYILAALRHKKHVITANKAVIARYMDEFSRVATENNVKFYFESSVGGGIPWIQGLERALRIDSIDTITGIFNGTSNYILDQMDKTGREFNDVLHNAQELGYAEADPSDDIDGIDVANKLCISADIAYDRLVLPDDHRLPIFGIRNINRTDIEYFNQQNLTVKLLGKSFCDGKQFDYAVEPSLCKASAIEASVPDNYNVISLHGGTIGMLKFMGQGAGQLPTANAVIQDILDIYQGKEHLQRAFKSSLKFNPNLNRRHYLIRTRVDVVDIFEGYQLTVHDNYVLVRDIPVGIMHDLMKEILIIDELAFMTCVPEDLETTN
ncbi:homoserine dehydrogenase [Lentilactobacillus kosonis]|uniref:Homoserine dehydrogenase n=1 Tax=Lentilactobacillus kosonis TaxID=2810561 RepID=A0A401FJF5_9LACO|nr:homoserine dehydrogenase [Lentilactobacillus kosonis]GAY72504.1 homoserine dehydrogenase [Lentilactobacillus kosonis]